MFEDSRKGKSMKRIRIERHEDHLVRLASVKRSKTVLYEKVLCKEIEKRTERMRDKLRKVCVAWVVSSFLLRFPSSKTSQLVLYKMKAEPAISQTKPLHFFRVSPVILTRKKCLDQFVLARKRRATE